MIIVMNDNLETKALLERARGGDRDAFDTIIGEYRDRLSTLRSLEPGERDRIRSNAERFRAMPPEERKRLRGMWQRLEQMSPEQRARLLERLEGEFPPDPDASEPRERPPR